MRSPRPAASRTAGRLPGRRPGAWATPTTSCVERAAAARERRWPSSRRAGRRATRRPGRTPRRRTAARPRCSAHYVDVVRPLPQARALPVLLDRRRHPAPRRGAGPVQAALPAPAASWSTPAASCPTTCRWCSSSPRCADPDAGRGAAAGVPAEPRAAPARAGRGRRRPYAGVRRGRLRDAAGRVARRPAPPCMAMAAPGPPREAVGLDAYDPRLLPLQPVGER